ncbi:MAG: hypothetical protein EXR99_06030 [Gemmataceae bacterium]|nr:hypothetical protein [Gemmataceae bacterium]
MRVFSIKALACLVFLWMSEAVFAGDWPQFRGPGGSAVANESSLPVRWSAQEGLAWKIPLQGRGLSCPVIAGGRLFLTSCSGYRQNKLHILAFDPLTGKQLWERQLASTGNPTCHPKTCMAAPTPATDGQRVFTLFATGDLAAFDRDGNLLWYRSLEIDYPDITNMVGLAASPVLWKDVLVVPMDNAGDSLVVAVDARTGKNLWKISRPRIINWSTPAIVAQGAHSASVILQTENSVLAVDAQTGSEKWKLETPGPSTVPTPTSGEGLLLAPGKETLVLDATGKSVPTPKWKSPKLAGGYSSPLIHQGKIYGLSSIGLNVFDSQDGKEIALIRMKGPFSGSPVIGANHLYLVNEEGTAFVVRLGEKPELAYTNELKDTILCTPALSNGRIYFRSDAFLYCVGPVMK